MSDRRRTIEAFFVSARRMRCAGGAALSALLFALLTTGALDDPRSRPTHARVATGLRIDAVAREARIAARRDECHAGARAPAAVGPATSASGGPLLIRRPGGLPPIRAPAPIGLARR